MKKFILTVLAYAGIVLSMCILPCLIIDPYNVFHWENIRNYGVEPNKNYIKTKYIINNPDKFEGYIFGSSRVGAINTSKIESEKVYNMTYSQGMLDENFETIKVLVENGVNVKSLYIGIDCLTYTTSPDSHYGSPLQSSYKYLKDHPLTFISQYLNPKTAVSSLRQIHATTMGGYDSFYSTGSWCEYGATAQREWWNDGEKEVGPLDRFDETLILLQEVVDYCDANNIKLTLFTNPVYIDTYNASVELRYEEYLEEVAKIHPYYNFSGVNDISLNHDNFVDSTHYKAEVGDLIIDTIWNNKNDETLYAQGFGVYVD